MGAKIWTPAFRNVILLTTLNVGDQVLPGNMYRIGLFWQFFAASGLVFSVNASDQPKHSIINGGAILSTGFLMLYKDWGAIVRSPWYCTGNAGGNEGNVWEMFYQ